MIVPTDNMDITQDTTFTPGVYFLPSGIKLGGSNITLDGNGAVLVGEDFSRSGIFVSQSENITIKNFSLQGYYWGIQAETCNRLTISNCKVFATSELPANTIFLDIWTPVEKAYGAGILLYKVSDSIIQDCDLSHQMNGLLTYKCEHLIVMKSSANYCSGWGFHLNNTSNCLFKDNSADFCCRYEPRGPRMGHMGSDAAGFLIVNRSCNNKFLDNNARLGGDGFFLAGMNPEYESVGCDDNLFEGNDGSYSPNNAFEATFSKGNIFRSNYANHSNYGFWLGFSRGGTLENNQLIGNRQAGIAVENGINFDIRDNSFTNNRHGILLWSRLVPELERARTENSTSRDWLIEKNFFSGNHKAIRIAADQDHGIRPLPEDGHLGLSAPKPANHVIRSNEFHDNIYVIDQINTFNTLIEHNQYFNNQYD